MDVTTRETVLVPAGACFLRYAPPTPPICFPNETTGCAAAANLDEAIVRGFLEVVERDAVALWWYNRRQAPAIDLRSFHNPMVERLEEYLRSRGRTLYALDISADSEIPVIAAISATVDGDAVMFGFAADFCAATALDRALLEVVQILGPLKTWSKEGMLKHYNLPPDRRAWVEYATTANQAFLNPSHETARIPGEFSGELPAADRRLQACVEVAGRMRLPLLAADMTRADIGVPVAKVIVTGFRSSWAHFGPGRLYSVPVALGWRDKPCAEEDLNSFPFFL